VARVQRRTTNENIIDFDQAQRSHRQKNIELIPRTRNQEKLVLSLQNPNEHIVVTTGPAGTGKTYLAVLRAVQALRKNECKRIVLVRPAVAVDGEQHGFLPGDLNKKLEPWCLPLLDILHECYKPIEVTKMIEDKVIEMAPLSMMRGRTLKDVFLILDEAQNASPNQVKMLLTRIGEGSKFVITGDTAQSDKKVLSNGLADLTERLINNPVNGMIVCQFTNRDIQRHKLIGKILELYGE
jgi:phosphate starvation-inducible PhoH-like protein